MNCYVQLGRPHMWIFQLMTVFGWKKQAWMMGLGLHWVEDAFAVLLLAVVSGIESCQLLHVRV